MHDLISVEAIDASPSKQSLLVSPSKTNKTGASEAGSEPPLDFFSVGKDIMADVSTGPRSCRMGDIYHRIKQEVDKISKLRNPRQSPKRKGEGRTLRRLRYAESEESEDSLRGGEGLYEFAEKLREQIERDPT